MKRLALFGALALLAACGADGEPVTPSTNATVSVGTNGVNVGASVGVTRGPVSIRVGL